MNDGGCRRRERELTNRAIKSGRRKKKIEKNRKSNIPKSPIASAHRTVNKPHETYQIMKLTEIKRENGWGLKNNQPVSIALFKLPIRLNIGFIKNNKGDFKYLKKI